MMKQVAVLVFLLFMVADKGEGGTVNIISQWVSSVRNFSTQYSTTSWGSVQIVGPPDTYPSYGTIATAWAPLTTHTTNEFIEFAVNSTVCVSSIETYETYNSGFVTMILALMPNGTWNTLWNGTASLIDSSRIFSPPLQSAAYTTNIFRIYMSGMMATSGTQYIELDAVRVNGSSTCPDYQWVSIIRNFSSAYGPQPSSQIIGPPNCYPAYGNCGGAWAQAVFPTVNESIEFEVAHTVCVTSIEIYETRSSGSVVQILAWNPNGSWFELWSGAPISLQSSRIFAPSLRPTNFSTKIFKISLNCSLAASYVELDAIKVTGDSSCPSPYYQWVSSIRAFSSQYGTQPATQIIGPPNCSPYYGNCGGAWAQAVFPTVSEFIEFEIADTVCVAAIEIYETRSSGSVVQILALKPDGSWDELWSGNPIALQSSRIFAPILQQKNYVTKTFRVNMNCSLETIYVELDAIRVVGSPSCPVQFLLPVPFTFTNEATIIQQPTGIVGTVNVISQWVSSVTSFSSQYSTTGWGSMQTVK